MAHPLDGCRAKLTRANHHILQINKDLFANIKAYYLPGNSIKARTDPVSGPCPGSVGCPGGDWRSERMTIILGFRVFEFRGCSKPPATVFVTSCLRGPDVEVIR